MGMEPPSWDEATKAVGCGPEDGTLALAAFYLLVGLWRAGRERSLEFEDQQSPQGFG